MKNLNKRKLICLDVDGTLCQNGIIPKSTKEALIRLKANNHKVILSTGRSLDQLDDILNQITIDGAILCNGGYGYLNSNVFFNEPLDREVILDLFSRIDEIPNAGHAYLGMNYFGTSSKSIDMVMKVCEVFTISGLKIDQIYPLNHDIYSLGVYTYENIAHIIKAFPMLRFIKVADFAYDVVSKDISKALPLRKLSDEYEIYAFGDNNNDIEMLRYADYGICMGNGSEEAKKSANYVTKSIFEDGLALAMEKYELI